MYGIKAYKRILLKRDIEISRAVTLSIAAMTGKVNDKEYILNISPLIVLQFFINLIFFMAIAKEI